MSLHAIGSTAGARKALVSGIARALLCGQDMSLNSHDKVINFLSKRSLMTEKDSMLDQILDRAVSHHVPSHGWTRKSLQVAAEELSLSPASCGAIRGPGALVQHLNEQCNDELEKLLNKEAEKAHDETQTSRHDKLLFGLTQRVIMLSPYRQLWASALAIQATPGEAVYAVENVKRLSDCIVRYAGDSSLDLRWYTQRAIVGSVYSAAEVYSLTDRSEGLEDTIGFIDRNLRLLHI
ncbi:hypothetical protein M9434_000398 [Picochlorum sp. BPE23]|nr:hypothetical protein M9434_000398 [Picochlorum sp. BPE23]